MGLYKWATFFFFFKLGHFFVAMYISSYSFIEAFEWNSYKVFMSYHSHKIQSWENIVYRQGKEIPPAPRSGGGSVPLAAGILN